MVHTGTVHLDLWQKETENALKKTGFFDTSDHTAHYTIEFPQAFETLPTVMLSITGLISGGGSFSTSASNCLTSPP